MLGVSVSLLMWRLFRYHRRSLVGHPEVHTETLLGMFRQYFTMMFRTTVETSLVLLRASAHFKRSNETQCKQRDGCLRCVSACCFRVSCTVVSFALRADLAGNFDCPNCALRLKRSLDIVFHYDDVAEML